MKFLKPIKKKFLLHYNEDLPEQLSRVKTRENITEGNSKIFDILPKILIGVFVIGAAVDYITLFLIMRMNNANEQ